MLRPGICSVVSSTSLLFFQLSVCLSPFAPRTFSQTPRNDKLTFTIWSVTSSASLLCTVLDIVFPCKVHSAFSLNPHTGVIFVVPFFQIAIGFPRLFKVYRFALFINFHRCQVVVKYAFACYLSIERVI